ncbi:MAG: gliding motility-associated C-terminal domain-containing protein [Saprospiraceae bacterium]|nr:gliding motility-associated C-terminal domain-containing protein [Saprospiraceae bacterium]
MRLWTVIILFYLFAVNAWSQPQLLEDFETDLVNWTLIQGKAELSDLQSQQGAQSLRMSEESTDRRRSIMEFDGLDDSFGRYNIWFYCTGDLSDADFYFQYQDASTYYRVSCRPTGTDNPGVSFHRGSPQGDIVLRDRTMDFALNQWHLLTVERFCDGHTHVDINGVELIHDIDDVTFAERGKVRLESWSKDTYFDAFSFTPFQPEPLLGRRDTICAGDVVVIGGQPRIVSGLYNEILREDGLCRTEQAVDLYVIPVDTMLIRDTMCRDRPISWNNRTYSRPGLFFDQERVTEGCGDIYRLELEEHPHIEAQDSFGLCPLIGTEISPGPYEYFLWEGGSEESHYQVTKEDTVGVIVRDANLCRQQLSIILKDVCPLETFAPSGFTPNGDGLNDYFQVYHNKNPEEFHMMIFNRFGQLIFETHDRQGWDGTIAGVKANPAVYLYYLVIDGKSIAGDVTLIR